MVRGGPETAAWLAPMIDEAKKRCVDITPLLQQAWIPAVEADIPALDWFGPLSARKRCTDWVQFGRLLRHQLGWDDTYPAPPDDFPEMPDIP